MQLVKGEPKVLFQLDEKGRLIKDAEDPSGFATKPLIQAPNLETNQNNPIDNGCPRTDPQQIAPLQPPNSLPQISAPPKDPPAHNSSFDEIVDNFIKTTNPFEFFSFEK
jgi:hypothetical protein